jgi:hypothetical protein
MLCRQLNDNDLDRMADPDASKPDDWHETEPRFLDDMTAVKPAGWLDNGPVCLLGTLLYLPSMAT